MGLLDLIQGKKKGIANAERGKTNLRSEEVSRSLPPITEKYLHNGFADYSEKPTPGDGGKIFDQAIPAWNASNYEKALDLLGAAVAAGLRGPELSCALSLIGQIYIHKGKFELAVEHFLKCLEIPDRVPSMSWQAAMHLYYIYDELGRRSEANSLLSIAEKANEGHRWMHAPEASRDARLLTRKYAQNIASIDGKGRLTIGS